MLAPKLPENQKALVVQPQPVRVVLAEDLPHTLAVVLPPIDDMAEMQELSTSNFSIEELSSSQVLDGRKGFQAAYSRLLEKEAEYSGSAVFLSKLASLAHLAGYKKDESLFARRAFDLGKDDFYGHRVGDALLNAGDVEEAEKFLASLDLSSDIGANLRLASFCVERRDFDRAEHYVNAAFEIDPLDFNTRLFDGGIQLFNGKYWAAVQSFRAALNERPTSSSAYSNLALAYLGVREERKALASVKRAVALDPLSANSVLLLADLSFRMLRDEDAIPALRFFIQYEQKNAAVWSRLARASYRIGRFDESIAALKREGSLRDSSSVWNNLGVAYLKLKDSNRALASFAHAMRMDSAIKTRTFFLAARNIAHLFSDKKRYSEVRKLAGPILKSSDCILVARDDEVSDLVVFHVNALLKDGHVDEARRVAREVLSQSEVSDSLAIWLVSALVAYQALHGGEDDVVALAEGNDDRATRLREGFRDRREKYFNNVAFALAELGLVSDAEKHLLRINDCIHKSAYPTATLGLIHFRKGNVDRAKGLYEEAVRLAHDKSDKARIRQKLNLELGKYWVAQSEPLRARRLLERAAGEAFGESALANQANSIIGSIRRLGSDS